MKRYRLLPLLWLCLLSIAGGATAQTTWHDLPPEERRQLRQQMREHWAQERGDRPEENRRRWQDVPPEERQRLREEMRQQRHRETAGEGLRDQPRERPNHPPPAR
jgi:hypothetical protein